jgi:hypothetical protein
VDLRQQLASLIAQTQTSPSAAGGQVPTPFTQEGPQFYAQAYQQNAPFAKAGPYQTRLPASQEEAFRQWVKSKGVPFDPNAPVVDYDMRGYFAATGGRGWKQGSHFPDTFKTPMDTTFSNESKYATADNPFVWKGDYLVDRRTGQVVFQPGPQQN